MMMRNETGKRKLEKNLKTINHLTVHLTQI